MIYQGGPPGGSPRVTPLGILLGDHLGDSQGDLPGESQGILVGLPAWRSCPVVRLGIFLAGLGWQNGPGSGLEHVRLEMLALRCLPNSP